VSGALEKHVPNMPGLWWAEIAAQAIYLPKP